MTAREIICEIDKLLKDWSADPDMTTAEFVCVQCDNMIAPYLKRPTMDHGAADEEPTQ